MFLAKEVENIGSSIIPDNYKLILRDRGKRREGYEKKGEFEGGELMRRKRAERKKISHRTQKIERGRKRI